MAAVVETFKKTLDDEGLWTALRWLNSKVPYRYTAVFAFEGDALHNICLVDKEDPAVTYCGDQAISESYCLYIHHSGETFTVEEALLDARVEGHPKRTSFQCYYGVPLVGSDGKLLGTVCHFDVDPVRLTADVVMILDDVAPLITNAAFDREYRRGLGSRT